MWLPANIFLRKIRKPGPQTPLEWGFRFWFCLFCFSSRCFVYLFGSMINRPTRSSRVSIFIAFRPGTTSRKALGTTEERLTALRIRSTQGCRRLPCSIRIAPVLDLFAIPNRPKKQFGIQERTEQFDRDASLQRNEQTMQSTEVTGLHGALRHAETSILQPCPNTQRNDLPRY